MRKAFTPYGLIGLAVLLLAQGCGTIEFSRKPDPGTAGHGGARSVAPIPKSEALARYSMALIAQEAGDEEAAVEHYREAIRHDPDNPQIKLDLAVGLLQQGLYNELDVVLAELSETHPELIRVHQLTVLGLRLRGRNAEALPPLQKAIALEPSEPMHYIEAASIHLRSENYEEARVGFDSPDG